MLGAPTLRLRGDYLAIVTLAFGEIVPRVFELSTSGPFGIGNIDISNGRQGITPVDKPYLPVPGIDDITRIELTPFYFVALAMVRDRAVRQLPPARLAARPRVDRGPRGRGRGRRDGRPPGARQAVGVRDRRGDRRLRRRVPRRYQNTVNVDQFEFGFSVFILCMVIIGGMGNIGGVILGAIALSMVDRFLLPELNRVPEKLGLDFDVTAINFGIFGFLLL